MSDRHLEIPRSRLPRWVGGFLDAHGLDRWASDGDDVVVHGRDGSSARLVAPAPGAFDGVSSLRTLVGHPRPRPTAVLLVRRGGYAVGVAHEGRLLASKSGTRYVQSRTAAGGWSQQRYARRRENQADDLVRSVVGHLVALTVHREDIVSLAVGGDRLLVEKVLSDVRLSTLAGLPRRELDAVREPRRAVLEDAARRVDAVHVIVTDPKENTVPTSRELLPNAADATRRLVEAVPQQAWERPSPDEGWTARDVLNHLTSEHLWAPHLLRGETLEQVGDRYDGDVLGDEPVQAFASALHDSLAAWSSTEVGAVHTSGGEIPTKEYAQQMLVDLVVHGWDIARATSSAYSPDADTVDAALRYLSPRIDAKGEAGIFKAPVSTSSKVRIDQLVALTGRDPHWSPQA